MNHFRFTINALEKLKPAEQEQYFHDTACSGLGLRLSPKGKQTFFALIDRKRKMLKTQVLETARKMTHELQIQTNVVSQDFTIGSIFALWMAHKAKPHKRTWKRDQARYDQYLLPWAKKRISEVTKLEVTALHNSIRVASGPYAANDTLAFLSSLYGYAERFDYDGKNPCRFIDRFPEQERERFLTAEEFPRWHAAVMTLSVPVARDFFLLCLWTGIRRECVLGMRWDQLDLEGKLWRIPHESDKGKRDLTVYLSDEALQVLRLRQAHAQSEWVLPSSSSASGHYAEPKSAWKSVLKRSGITNLRIHDLRRTLGSWMAEGGTSLHIIGQTLGHKSLQATRIYARLGGTAVRNAVNAATSAMKETLGDKE